MTCSRKRCTRPRNGFARLCFTSRAGATPLPAARGEALRTAAVARHGKVQIAALEAMLAERSQLTRTNALRWAARGLPAALAIAKVNLEKAARSPYVNRTA